jgi:hypothetical protein
MNYYYGQYYDLIDENFIPERAAARLLGRQMQAIRRRSAQLKERIIRILELSTMDAARSPMGTLIIQGKDKTVSEVVALLKELLAGINDPLPSSG